MIVLYSDKAKQEAEGYIPLQQATKQLEEVVRRLPEGVKAEWDRDEDSQGRPLYTLLLSDDRGSVSTAFTPEELQSPRDMVNRLRLLWESLLDMRIHQQLRELQEMGKQES